MDFSKEESGKVTLRVSPEELELIRGSLLVASDAISDEVAYHARVGVPKASWRPLFEDVVHAQRLFRGTPEGDAAGYSALRAPD